MKRIGTTLTSILAAGTLATGCSWTAFDELADETWVDAVGAAEGVSPNQFLGLATPGTSSHNAVFVALGRATDSVGSYSYDADGARSTVGVAIRGTNDTGGTNFGPLPAVVPIAGDPYSNRVGVAAITGQLANDDTKVASFEADNIGHIDKQNDFNGGPLDGPIQPTGLVYARTDDDGPDTTTTDILLARGPQLALVRDYSSVGHTLVGCYGASSGDVVMNVAAGQFDGDDADDELVAVINNASGTAPQIVIFNGSAIVAAWNANGQALGGCFDDGDPARTPIARINGPAGVADFGTQVVVGDFNGDGLPDLAVSAYNSNQVRAYINQGNLTDYTEYMVGAPVAASWFGRSMATGDLDGDGRDELVIGAPRSNVGDTVNAGVTSVYGFDDDTFRAVRTVHDAQPQAEQRMGTSVAVVAWTAGNRKILVVAGEKEIFTYFRLALTDDDVRGQ